MAFAAHFSPSSYIPGASADVKHPRPNLLVRLLHAVVASRRARAEAEVARFIEERGGRVTDDLEREISRRFGGPVQ
ncbi:MAG TPA: hypothetical protein VF601_23365 [Beijerinckiaceae bacterium]